MRGDRQQPPISDEQLDRLVDGELDETARRALLGTLETEPDGWRRCALAFLEAQTWRQALGGVVPAPAPTAEIIPAAAAAAKASRWHTANLWAGRLAIAASLLVAVVLGAMVGPTFRRAGAPSAIAPPVVAQDTQRGAAGQAPLPIAAAGGPSNPWQLVTLSTPADAQQPSAAVRLPAVQRDRVDEQLLRNMPGPVPRDVLQLLRKSGHQVDQVRDVVPVRLRDGRQLLVPVDQIDLRYLGDRAFQ